MENKKSFFSRLEPVLAPSELVKVKGAYYMAKYGHRAQVRKEFDNDGSPLRYFEHVRRVAIILIDEAKCYNPDLICAALLHDAVEDTDDLDIAVIEQFFGTKTARIVRILTKTSEKELYFDRIYRDQDAKLIKVCDRLDNLRSLPEDDPDFCEKQINETHQYIWAFADLDPKYNELTYKIENIIYD